MKPLAWIALVFFCPAVIFTSAEAARAEPWGEFKSKFITSDGRIIDFYQNQCSHSEGQAYGLLLALGHNEADLFEKIWSWTENNLQMRGSDRLLSWQWGRRPNGRWTILDYNNASDGDLIVTWALLSAADKWDHDRYRAAAGELAADMARHLVLEKQGRLLLLPAYQGFVHGNSVDINPSYFVFPALGKLSALGEPWPRLREDLMKTLKDSLFSSLELPADWVSLKQGRFVPHEDRGHRFSYDAIRVPLYLAWDGQLAALPGLERVLDLVERLGYVPEFIDLVRGSAALNPAGAGFYAVLARVARDMGRTDLSRLLQDQARSKLKMEKNNYYSQVLYLLAEAHP